MKQREYSDNPLYNGYVDSVSVCVCVCASARMCVLIVQSARRYYIAP